MGGGVAPQGLGWVEVFSEVGPFNPFPPPQGAAKASGGVSTHH